MGTQYKVEKTMSEGGVCQKKLLFYIVWQGMGIGTFSLSSVPSETRRNREPDRHLEGLCPGRMSSKGEVLE